MKDQKEGGKTKDEREKKHPKKWNERKQIPEFTRKSSSPVPKTTGLCPFALLATHASCLHLFPCFYYELSLQGSGMYPLTWTAFRGCLSIANLLLQAGATVDAVNDYGGRTALHQAAFMGKIQVVEALLNAGADKALKSKYGDTALNYAQSQNHPAIVKLLRD